MSFLCIIYQPKVELSTNRIHCTIYLLSGLITWKLIHILSKQWVITVNVVWAGSCIYLSFLVFEPYPEFVALEEVIRLGDGLGSFRELNTPLRTSRTRPIARQWPWAVARTWATSMRRHVRPQTSMRTTQDRMPHAATPSSWALQSLRRPLCESTSRRAWTACSWTLRFTFDAWRELISET